MQIRVTNINNAENDKLIESLFLCVFSPLLHVQILQSKNTSLEILYHLHWTLLLHAYSIYEMHRIVHTSERDIAAMEEMEIFLDIPGGQMNNTQWLIQYHALYMQQTKGSSVCHLPLHLTCMLCLPLTAPSLTCWQIVLSAWWKPKILSCCY